MRKQLIGIALVLIAVLLISGCVGNGNEDDGTDTNGDRGSGNGVLTAQSAKLDVGDKLFTTCGDTIYLFSISSGTSRDWVGIYFFTGKREEIDFHGQLSGSTSVRIHVGESQTVDAHTITLIEITHDVPNRLASIEYTCE